MRSRPHNRDAVSVTGQRIAGSGASPDPGGSRAQDPSLRRVSAPRSELDNFAVIRGMNNARRLGRDQRLKRDAGKQIRLRYLALDQRRTNIENGLPFIKYRTLRNGENIAREPESSQVIPELLRGIREVRKAAQVVNLIRLESQVEQVFDRPVKASHHHEFPVARQSADGELENSDLRLLTGGEVARCHGELIEIGQEAVHLFFLGASYGLIPEIAFCRSSKFLPSIT